MFLTDRELRARLAEFDFQAEHDQLAFDPDRQIGPCSIDLRLSLVYWKPKAGRRFGRLRVLDLERTRTMELLPRRGWDKHALRPGEKLTLRPGELVLGRVSERFRVPSDCAALIEGRSSYARLGLSVHATGGFINPGWQGHMPLTLVNHSPVTLRIPVGTPLCQLLIVKLDQAPERDYAQRSDRKYINDIGGPSYWWRDALMRELRESLSKANLGSRAYDDLEELLSNADDEELLGVLSRLEDLLERPPRSYGSADEMLDDFADREGRLRRRNHFVGFIFSWIWTVALGFAAATWLSATPLALRVASAIVAAGSLAVIPRGFSLGKGAYLDSLRLEALRREREKHSGSARP